jgi:hypothetical protein
MLLIVLLFKWPYLLHKNSEKTSPKFISKHLLEMLGWVVTMGVVMNVKTE